jgi:hypothetical protein
MFDIVWSKFFWLNVLTEFIGKVDEVPMSIAANTIMKEYIMSRLYKL